MQPTETDRGGAATAEATAGGGVYPLVLRWVATLPFQGERRGGRLRKRLTRGWYQFLSFMDRRVSMIFMNYGYAPPDDGATPLELEPGDESDRYCIQLYHRVASAVDLRGKQVLEVGSGRGGGASYVARYLRPRLLTGVDYAARAVRFSERAHRAPNLRFTAGDAEAMPFDDAAFDAVLNVESSHCYPSMERFAREAARVLRPGGHLLFADMRHRDAMPAVRSAFAAAGLECLEEEEITGGVLRALQQDNDRKLALIRRDVPRVFRPLFCCFAGIEGTRSFESFTAGDWVYWRFVLRRPPTPRPSAAGPTSTTAGRPESAAREPRDA